MLAFVSQATGHPTVRKKVLVEAAVHMDQATEALVGEEGMVVVQMAAAAPAPSAHLGVVVEHLGVVGVVGAPRMCALSASSQVGGGHDNTIM